MEIDSDWIDRFSPASDFIVVMRPDFDFCNPQGLIYEIRSDRIIIIESDAINSLLIKHLVQSGCQQMSVEEYRSWQLSLAE